METATWISVGALAVSLISLSVSLWTAVHDRRRKIRVEIAFGRLPGTKGEHRKKLWLNVTITNAGRAPVTVTEAKFTFRADDGAIKERPFGIRLPATLGQSERVFINLGSGMSWGKLKEISAKDSLGKRWRVSDSRLRALRRETEAAAREAEEPEPEPEKPAPAT